MLAQRINQVLSEVASRIQEALTSREGKPAACRFESLPDGSAQVVIRSVEPDNPLLVYETVVLTSEELATILTFIKAEAVQVVRAEGGELGGS